MVKWVRIYLFCFILLLGFEFFPVHAASYWSGCKSADLVVQDLKGISILNKDAIEDSSVVTVKKSNSSPDDTLVHLGDTILLTPADFFISFEKDSLKKAWKDYLTWLNGVRDSVSPDGTILVLDSADKESFFQITESSFSKSGDSLNAFADSIDSSQVETATNFQELVIHQNNPEIKQSHNPPSDKYSRFPFYFVIQVAASKVNLDSAELKNRYDGPFEVKKLEEGGWYKYQIGQTENYLEALQVLKSVSSNDCFLVAYNAEGEKLKLWKAVLSQRKKLMHFRVQIAASTIPLKDQEILDIYDGEMKILEIEEEGWYKYQIDLGKDYNAARRKEKQINVEGAFMVPYLGDQKMPLYKVLKFYRF